MKENRNDNHPKCDLMKIENNWRCLKSKLLKGAFFPKFIFIYAIFHFLAKLNWAKCMLEKDIPTNYMIFNNNGCQNETIDQGRSYIICNINISHCFFLRFSYYSHYGGIIYISGGSYAQNIFFTTFLSCLASNGGAIYFSSKSSSLIKMACISKCYAQENHFAYVESSKTNQIEYLSISQCTNITTGKHVIKLWFGDQKFDNSNSSFNNVEEFSGISLIYPSISSCSFCSFAFNNAKQSCCIELIYESGLIQYSNIICNNSPDHGGIITISESSYQMSYCIFSKNLDSLFNVQSGNLEIMNSFIFHEGILSISTPVSVYNNNNSFSYTSSYEMRFFSSQNCPAENPFIYSPSVTSIMQPTTIQKTNSFTPKQTYANTDQPTNNFTPEHTITYTYLPTSDFTPEPTIINTNQQSNINTDQPTSYFTPEQTNANTDQPSSYFTPEHTIIFTNQQTNNITPKQTNDVNHNSSKITKLIIIFSIPILLILIIFIIFFQKNPNDDNSSINTASLIQTNDGTY